MKKAIQELWRHHVTSEHFDEICYLLEIDENQAFDKGQFFGFLGLTERFMFYQEKKYGYGLLENSRGTFEFNKRNIPRVFTWKFSKLIA